MLIEQIFKEIVNEKGTLRERLLTEAKARAVPREYMEKIMSKVPSALINADAYLDKMTNLWRYEFGIPYQLGKELVWGAHMWVPVRCLFDSLMCASLRLPENTCIDYFNRLANPGKHQSTLVEMIPVQKINTAIVADFEVSGLGIGNKTIDWVIGPHCGRTVLLDVKRRMADFIQQTESVGSGSVVPEPKHDPTLLFRSVEDKFKPADPNQFLQGVWIVTDIKQNEQKLFATFATLDQTKVHFAILGDWKPDAYLLVTQADDEKYLRELFRLQKSARFTFKTNES
jgi:hypothetical protein